MNAGATPSDKVVQALQAVGYSSRPVPLQIRSLSFDFAAVLVGPTPLPDLVVIVDTAAEQPVAIKGKIEGLARALDFMESRRPLTSILVGPSLPLSILEALLRFSRILTVDSSIDCNDTEALRDRLAVLMPMVLPEAGGEVSDPLSELNVALGNAAGDETYRVLIEAAGGGKAAVQKAAQAILAQPFRDRRTGRA